MTVVKTVSPDEFEKIVWCRDEKTGLKAIIAIHDTTLGPAVDGTRMYPYATEEEALVDVMRLAKGMTYKSAISHLKLGGGKSVIIGNPEKDKTKALLKPFVQFVNDFNGKYICAKDVGIHSKDLKVI